MISVSLLISLIPLMDLVTLLLKANFAVGSLVSPDTSQIKSHEMKSAGDSSTQEYSSESEEAMGINGK